MTKNKTVFILAGPTASGKSAMALGWAKERFDDRAMIINADSQQVYREIPIISAQPNAKEQGVCPHVLYGFLSITDHYSAQDWRNDAVQHIHTAWHNDQTPIIVGGSGFYIQALTQGFSPLPDIPMEVRARVSQLYDDMGADAFHTMIMEKDKGAAKIHPNDRQRCVRMCEVFQETGRTLSYWQSQPLTGPPDGMIFDITVIMPDRDMLYDRIDQRFERMLDDGAMDEVETIYKMNLDPILSSIQACGIPELRAYLDNEVEYDEAVNKAKQSSRNYAKRQYTWFRNQLPDGHKTPTMTVRHLK